MRRLPFAVLSPQTLRLLVTVVCSALFGAACAGDASTQVVVLMDTDYAVIGDEHGANRYTEFEHSLFVLATVMSVPTAERAIVDAGLKSYSGEKGLPWVYGRADVGAVGMSDEHGKLKVGPQAKALRLGDRVQLIPGHCDPTVNLHDWYVGVRKGRVEALWPITARGASN